MRFDIKAFLRLMKQSWQGGGVKILRTEHRGLWDSFFHHRRRLGAADPEGALSQ